MLGNKKPRIINVTRKPSKCPDCGSSVVDIIYGTGDMTEIEFVLQYRKDGIRVHVGRDRCAYVSCQ